MNSSLLIGILGILSVIATEIINAINAKLGNGVLKGEGAFILSAAVAFVIGAFQVGFSGISFLNWQAFLASVGPVGSQIWVVSQVAFVGVYQQLGLDMPSLPPPPPAPAA